MNHALVKLAQAIDWRFLEKRFGAVYTDKPGQPLLPTRLMAGLAILKTFPTRLCATAGWTTRFQYFCGEEFFRHAVVFDRSSLTRWGPLLADALGGTRSFRRCFRRAWQWRAGRRR
jgi:IS5 family transposase